MPKVLINYIEIPDTTKFYLFTEDHPMVPVFEKAHGFFIGVKIDADDVGCTGDVGYPVIRDIEHALEIQTALDEISTYMFDWNGEGAENYQGLNPDMKQYIVDITNKNEINEMISKIIITGIYL
jgi:hypothetical protein